MINEKKVFKTNDSDELVRKSELLDMFWRSTLHLNESNKKFEILLKKGERFKFSGLEGIMLYPLSSDNSRVFRVDYSKFAQDALREIDSYRMISESGAMGDVYKIIDIHTTLSERIKEEGDYLVTVDNEPKFKVSTSSIMKGYRFESVKISSFDNKEFLNYIPSLLEKDDSRYRYNVEVEISVCNKDKNALYYTYKQILEKIPELKK